MKEILQESNEKRGPISKRLLLHEISSGEVVVKLDLQLYDGFNEWWTKCIVTLDTVCDRLIITALGACRKI